MKTIHAREPVHYYFTKRFFYLRKDISITRTTHCEFGLNFSVPKQIGPDRLKVFNSNYFFTPRFHDRTPLGEIIRKQGNKAHNQGSCNYEGIIACLKSV